MKRQAKFNWHAEDAARILGMQIRFAREEKRLTGQQLADMAGVSRRTVSQIENADPGVAIGSVLTVASVAGVALYDIPDKESLNRVRSTLDHALTLIPSNVTNRKEPGVSTDF